MKDREAREAFRLAVGTREDAEHLVAVLERTAYVQLTEANEASLRPESEDRVRMFVELANANINMCRFIQETYLT